MRVSHYDHITNPAVNALLSLPSERSTLAPGFIDCIFLIKHLNLGFGTRPNAFKEQELGGIVSDLILADVHRSQERSKISSGFDAQAFKERAGQQSELLTPRFLDTVPPNPEMLRVYAKGHSDLCAFGWVGLHALLSDPNKVAQTVYSKEYGAKYFEDAISAFISRVLKPFIKQLPQK